MNQKALDVRTEQWRRIVCVRTTDYEYEASISLENGEILAGELPQKLLKLAKKEIMSQ